MQKKGYRGDMRWQLCCTRRGNHIRVPISFLLSPPFYPEGDIALYTRAGLENKTRSRRRRAALPGLTHKAPCAVPRMIMAIFIKRGGGGAKLRKWSELNASMYAIVITFFLYRRKKHIWRLFSRIRKCLSLLLRAQVEGESAENFK